MTAGVRGVGLLVTAAGVALTLAAQTAMGACWRLGVDAPERMALVTGGRFGHVCNPGFTATVLTATGLALMVLDLVAIAALALLLAAIELQVRVVEEPCLSAGVHGIRLEHRRVPPRQRPWARHVTVSTPRWAAAASTVSSEAAVRLFTPGSEGSARGSVDSSMAVRSVVPRK